MGDVGRLGDGGDSALIENRETPGADGEGFCGVVHQAVFDLDETVWVPEDLKALLPAKCFVFLTGQSASLFGKEFE